MGWCSEGEGAWVGKVSEFLNGNCWGWRNIFTAECGEIMCLVMIAINTIG